ncbi:MAG: hypothetical protein V7607_2849 [Solirubrobacteraceae bacterium]
MSTSAGRSRTSQCAAVAVVAASLGLVVAGCGAGADADPDPAASTAAHASAAGPTCAQTVQGELRDVALRVYDQAARGVNVASSERRLAASSALATAVARGDAAATRAALRPLLRAQIQRIVVTRGSRVLADLGTGAAVAPVNGVLRDAAGAPVGRYTLSVGNDAGIASLIHAITGAQVVMRAGGHRVATTVAAAHGPLPASGAATVGGARYAVSSFAGTAFPTGSLQVWLLSPPASGALCGATRAATVANTIGAVGERLFGDEQRGAATARVLRVVAGDRGFIRAVATDDPAALRAAIVRFFGDPALHVVRIRAVTAGGTLVNDVGGPYVLAPASAPVRSSGRVIGRVTLSIQDDTGYVKLMHRFTGADVILRAPLGQVPGSTLSPGPSTVPSRGTVSYAGRTYQAFSFAAQAFPSGPLRISLLSAPASARTSRQGAEP